MIYPHRTSPALFSCASLVPLAVHLPSPSRRHRPSCNLIKSPQSSNTLQHTSQNSTAAEGAKVSPVSQQSCDVTSHNPEMYSSETRLQEC
ncbi:hypothetical protein CHARACLAT_024648 [Characodon lateralis]|uniref:Uncharacterized protein n=1 Tax=Characodon lateralis TaxID=208331 RepID=A0ABU7DJG0_9TELE|nr:hypothetical protein [Characodon lateralis]